MTVTVPVSEWPAAADAAVRVRPQRLAVGPVRPPLAVPVTAESLQPEAGVDRAAVVVVTALPAQTAGAAAVAAEAQGVSRPASRRSSRVWPARRLCPLRAAAT